MSHEAPHQVVESAATDEPIASPIPLDAATFASLMQTALTAETRYTPPHSLAVAVSGGADSLALAILAHEWAQKHGLPCTALTVDHGLRVESASEATRVAGWMQERGIPHHTLLWEGEKPTANQQARARDARYRLLAEWCAQRHVSHLLLAHHQDDQAETFLLRLARGSGVDGLAAMPAMRSYGRPPAPRLQILRPLLPVPKARLCATLQQQGQLWIDDPSNEDIRHRRVQVRHAMPELAALGLDTPTLAATADRMARARDYLQQQTALALADCLMNHEAGYLLLDYWHFSRLHEEIGLRVLAHAIGQMSGAIYRPRFTELYGVFSALGSPRTLAGCKFEPAGDKLMILREPAAVAPLLPLQQGETMWDARFRIVCALQCDGYHIGALGEQGWQHIRTCAPDFAALVGMPRTALLTLPAIWHLEKPVYVPHIGYQEQGENTAITNAIRIDRIGHLSYT